MRCLLFTDTIHDVNGVARFVQTLAGWAWAEGKEFCVLSSSAKPPTMDFPLRENIRIVPPLARMKLPGYSDLDVALPDHGALQTLAREFKPDVVHVSTPGPVGMCGKIIARKLGVPVVGTWHTDFAAYSQYLSGLSSVGEIVADLLRLFYHDFDLVLARSEASLPDIRQAEVKRYRAFAPGVDLQKFDPVWKDRSIWRRWELDPERRKVVYVGRVSKEKGVLILKDISDYLQSASIEADLVIVGSGPMQSRLQQLIPAATFAGFVHGPDLSRLYASSDVIVFPSETDTLGQVVLEAQASGVPVIVTDRGGPKFLVKNAVSGWVIPLSEISRWGRCIEEMLAHDARRKEMGMNARRHMHNYNIINSCQSFWSQHQALLHQLRVNRQ